MVTPMPTQTLTLEVPEPLYQRLKQRADKTRRSVAEESLQLLSASVPSAELTDELTAALASLLTMDESMLWNAARGRLPAEMSNELAMLNGKQQREGLTPAEAERLAELVRQYERQMLLRAQAAVLLKRRGHDVAELIAS